MEEGHSGEQVLSPMAVRRQGVKGGARDKNTHFQATRPVTHFHQGLVPYQYIQLPNPSMDEPMNDHCAALTITIRTQENGEAGHSRPKL